MNNDGYYYLHMNGSLIWKRFEPEIDPGGFVRKVWRVNRRDRSNAWLICIEALALGATKGRIMELAEKWGLTDDDALEFVKHAISTQGKRMFRLVRDGDQWCATFHDFVNLQESQAGFGRTALEAFADLARPGLQSRETRPTGLCGWM